MSVTAKDIKQVVEFTEKDLRLKIQDIRSRTGKAVRQLFKTAAEQGLTKADIEAAPEAFDSILEVFESTKRLIRAFERLSRAKTTLSKHDQLIADDLVEVVGIVRRLQELDSLDPLVTLATIEMFDKVMAVIEKARDVISLDESLKGIEYGILESLPPSDFKRLSGLTPKPKEPLPEPSADHPLKGLLPLDGFEDFSNLMKDKPSDPNRPAPVDMPTYSTFSGTLPLPNAPVYHYDFFNETAAAERLAEAEANLTNFFETSETDNAVSRTEEAGPSNTAAGDLDPWQMTTRLGSRCP